jgi:hypothetical protein
MLLTDPVGLIERADATIQAVGEINDDGMGRVFAANVFGHYVMVTKNTKIAGATRLIFHCFYSDAVV